MNLSSFFFLIGEKGSVLKEFVTDCFTILLLSFLNFVNRELRRLCIYIYICKSCMLDVKID